MRQYINDLLQIKSSISQLYNLDFTRSNNYTQILNHIDLFRLMFDKHPELPRNLKYLSMLQMAIKQNIVNLMCPVCNNNLRSFDRKIYNTCSKECGIKFNINKSDVSQKSKLHKILRNIPENIQSNQYKIINEYIEEIRYLFDIYSNVERKIDNLSIIINAYRNNFTNEDLLCKNCFINLRKIDKNRKFSPTCSIECGYNFRNKDNEYKINNLLQVKSSLITCNKLPSFTNEFYKFCIEYIEELRYLFDKYPQIERNIKNISLVKKLHNEDIVNPFCCYCQTKLRKLTDKNHLLITCNNQQCKELASNSSQFEVEICNFLNKNNINYLQRQRILNGQEIDILLTEHNLGIEFNGGFWHSEQQGKDNNYHLNKTLIAKDKGIQLIHIFDFNFVGNESKWFNFIKAKCKKITNKIYAKNCIVKSIDREYLSFINSYSFNIHDSNIKYGLFYNDELVSIIGVSIINNEYWLDNYATKFDLVVVGGLSKLINYFVVKYQPKQIKCNLDRCYNDGKLLEKIGFKLIDTLAPDCVYLKPNSFFTNKDYHENHYKVWGCGYLTYER